MDGGTDFALEVHGGLSDLSFLLQHVFEGDCVM